MQQLPAPPASVSASAPCSEHQPTAPRARPARSAERELSAIAVSQAHSRTWRGRSGLVEAHGLVVLFRPLPPRLRLLPGRAFRSGSRCSAARRATRRGATRRSASSALRSSGSIPVVASACSSSAVGACRRRALRPSCSRNSMASVILVLLDIGGCCSPSPFSTSGASVRGKLIPGQPSSAQKRGPGRAARRGSGEVTSGRA